jgi:hypothetical protein
MGETLKSAGGMSGQEPFVISSIKYPQHDKPQSTGEPGISKVTDDRDHTLDLS